MEVRSTQDGILRAFHLLLTQSSNRKVKPKFEYAPHSMAVHAARCLSKAEAAEVNALVDEMKALGPAEQADAEKVQALLKQLSALPVKFVPVKRETSIDYSKTYR